VHQVIVNLVDNAMDAMRDVARPELSVRAFRDGNDIKIEISDNGAGISDEILDRIFEPFLQQNGSVKVPVWGCGSAMVSCANTVANCARKTGRRAEQDSRSRWRPLDVQACRIAVETEALPRARAHWDSSPSPSASVRSVETKPHKNEVFC